MANSVVDRGGDIWKKSLHPDVALLERNDCWNYCLSLEKLLELWQNYMDLEFFGGPSL